jgi:hypothetical protein
MFREPHSRYSASHLKDLSRVKSSLTDWSKQMVRIYRAAIYEMLLILFICNCSLPDKEERDWNRIRASATEYALSNVAAEIKKHLNKFPACRHRGAAEEYFVHSCKMLAKPALDDFCSDYLKTFPNGIRLAEVEEVFWHNCEKSSSDCFYYAKNFPNGARIAKAEEALWLECEKGSSFSCSSYTEAFPNGKHIAIARERKDVPKLTLEEERLENLTQEIENQPSGIGNSNCPQVKIPLCRELARSRTAPLGPGGTLEGKPLDEAIQIIKECYQLKRQGCF